jgi:ABC-type transporter Mla subunit MlaD
MSESYSPPQRFAGIDRKVNRFFVTALAGITAVVLLVSYKQGLFIPHTPLYFYAPDALGISNGTTVRLFGLQVGTVKDMRISDRGVKVEFFVATEYTPRIPKGSQIRLARESYIGGASLQIIPRADLGRASEPVAAGDEFEFVASRTIVEIVDDLKTQVTPLVSDVRGLLADFNRPDGDFPKSSAAARALLEQLPVTNQDARRLLRDADRTVLAAEATFGAVSRVSAQAEQQIPVLAGKLTTTLDSFADAAAQFREATRKNSDALHETLRQTPALVRDGNDLVRDGQEIVGAVRNAWPMRDLVETPATRTLAVDSFEAAVAVRDYPPAPR